MEAPNCPKILPASTITMKPVRYRLEIAPRISSSTERTVTLNGNEGHVWYKDEGGWENNSLEYNVIITKPCGRMLKNKKVICTN